MLKTRWFAACALILAVLASASVGDESKIFVVGQRLPFGHCYVAAGFKDSDWDIKRYLPAHLLERTTIRLETNPAKIEFTVTMPRSAFRVADPIRLDLNLRNCSQLDCLTGLPVADALSSSLGARLEWEGWRGEKPRVVLESKRNRSSEEYGEIIRAGTTKTSRVPLAAVLACGEKPLWPLPPGKYRLTIIYAQLDENYIKHRLCISRSDPPRSPAEIVHRWTAPTITFTVAGTPRANPEAILFLACQCAGIERLDSGNMHNLQFWGDERLLPLLKERFSFSGFRYYNISAAPESFDYSAGTSRESGTSSTVKD